MGDRGNEMRRERGCWTCSDRARGWLEDESDDREDGEDGEMAAMATRATVPPVYQ